jgi:hypothetical protein
MPMRNSAAFASAFIGNSSLIRGGCKRYRLMNCQIGSAPPSKAGVRLCAALALLGQFQFAKAVS